MIDTRTVWDEIWPVVQELIHSTLDNDQLAVERLLLPSHFAAEAFDLFGLTVMTVLLKTVLGREQLGLARAIETDASRQVHIDFAWPDPALGDETYSADEVVSVQLQRQRRDWRVTDVNPASTDQPMTEARAQSILLASTGFGEREMSLNDPWILPVALFGGALQLPIREGSMEDAVERRLVPGLQQRAYGISSVVSGRRLWRDFREQYSPHVDDPDEWAAATEFIINEQTLREMSQAAVSQCYQIEPNSMGPKIERIKQELKIERLDVRYSPHAAPRVAVED